jgi:hypothetical protein
MMGEDNLLGQAKALYKDRIRIVLATLVIAFTATFYIFYSGGIVDLIPEGFPPGWISGLEVVVSFNTVGFAIAVFFMALAYKFWTWAFLPSPAVTYTLAVLHGILGPTATIKQTIGQRFKVVLQSGHSFDVKCNVHERGTDDWFVYRLTSMVIDSDRLRNIALRHGFGVKKGRMVASIGNDELHHRTLLLTKAMQLAAPAH